MNFVRTPRRRVFGRPVFRITATPPRALPPVGRIVPDYRPLFAGLDAALRREMAIIVDMPSRSAMRELERHIAAAGRAWLISPVSRKGLSSPHYRIMECWGL